MAFANKYLFRFESVHGVEYNIYILKDGYTGQVIQRALGRAPVIKKKQNGPICGTSLELYAECAVDGEFAELYTSNPKEYRVDVYRASTLIWTGFVSTELYSEPSIAPPYDVQIVATDGLGELKLNNFEAQGEISLKALFSHLLSFTGSSRAFYFATNLKHTGGTRSQMLNWTINVDFLKGETCYEVLTRVLDSLHATITTYGARWLVARETDIEALLNSSGNLSVVTLSASGTVGTTTITGARKTLGQRGSADFWPNGFLSTAIEPARKSVAVQAPWHMVGAFKGGDLTDQASVPYWSKDNFQTLDSRDLQWKPSTHFFNAPYYENSAYYIGDCLTGDNYGYIAQPISMSNIDNLDFEIEVRVRPTILYDINLWALQHGKINAFLVYTDGTGSLVGLADAGWRDGTDSSEYMDIGKVDAVPFQTLKFSIPKCVIRSTGTGTLTLYIKGRNIAVSYVNMKIAREAGFTDTVYIDNGARGEADVVEILGGRVHQDSIQNPDFYQGIWKYSGNVLYSFEDSNHSNGDFMSIQALDRAVSVALARTRTDGLVDMPSGSAMFPLIFRQGQQDSWIETWEWDLKAEDVKISALSVPNAQITVDSESVEPMDGSGSSSSGGGGGSNSSVGSINVGLTMPTGFSVEGSPVVGRGTINVVFSNGYALPLASDTQKGVTAYGWGNHSLEGYLKTAADIAAALGYVPAASTTAADLRRPRLKILRGWQNWRDPSPLAPTLLADHPLKGIGDAEFVLMVWSKRRGKGMIPGQGQYAWDGSQYKSAWGECRGGLATTAPLTFNSSITLDDLRLHILHTLVCIYGQSKPTSMTIAQFHALDTRFNPPRFGGLNSYAGTIAEFMEKTTGMRLFGIALRYTNPAFTALVSGELDETTRQLKSGASTYVDRYIYSDIAPIVVQIGASATPGQGCEIGFDIAGRLP